MNLKAALAGIPATMGKARGVGSDDAIEAALVAMPFAGAFGIWWNALTWWPNMVTFGLTVVAWIAITLWIAGHRKTAEE